MVLETGVARGQAGDVCSKGAYLLLGLSVNVDALQDIRGTSSAAYMQLCDLLAKDVLQETEGRLGKWESFLRRLWYVC